jgi:hypothetical protein
MDAWKTAFDATWKANESDFNTRSRKFWDATAKAVSMNADTFAKAGVRAVENLTDFMQAGRREPASARGPAKTDAK